MVRLPEVQGKVFRTYVHWCYTGAVLPEVYYQTADKDQTMERETYVEAYIIADILDDLELRTRVMGLLIEGIGNWKRQFNWGDNSWGLGSNSKGIASEDLDLGVENGPGTGS